MKKRAVRISIVFFAVMILLTFTSRTIYRSTLPKVKASKMIGGILKYRLVSDSLDVRANSYINEYIPYDLSRAITVEHVLKKPGTAVKFGNPLFSFYAPEGEQVLNDATKALHLAKDASSDWDVKLSIAKHELESKIEEAKTQEELETLALQQNLLLEGVLNGTSSRTIYSALEIAQSKVDYLRNLKENEWIYTASTDGILCSFSIEEGAAYSGLSPLCQIAEQVESVYLVVMPKDIPKAISNNWQWTVTINTSRGYFKSTVLSYDEKGLQIAIPNNLSIKDIVGVLIMLESPYHKALVPNSALTDNKVFLLDSSIGDWGQTVYSVREVRVVTGDTDEERTVIIEGLDKNDQVIVNSSAPLKDGQTVVLDTYR